MSAILAVFLRIRCSIRNYGAHFSRGLIGLEQCLTGRLQLPSRHSELSSVMKLFVVRNAKRNPGAESTV